jgi:hypothetical protein
MSWMQVTIQKLRIWTEKWSPTKVCFSIAGILQLCLVNQYTSYEKSDTENIGILDGFDEWEGQHEEKDPPSFYHLPGLDNGPCKFYGLL